MDKVEEIHSFLKLLINPLSGDSSTDEQKRFENSLKRNLETALTELNSSKLDWLKESMKEIHFEGDSEDICCQFTSYVAKTLVCLSNSLSTTAQRFQDEEQRSSILSFHQQNDIQFALQLLTCFGISRNLLPGVGVSLYLKSQFGKHLFVAKSRDDGSDFQKYQILFSTVKSLFSLCRNATLGSLVLSKFLGDYLAALCQLCYAPLKKKSSFPGKTSESNLKEPVSIVDEEEKRQMDEQITRVETDRKHCFVILNFVLDHTLKRKVVRELLFLQGSLPKSGEQLTPAPNWLRKATQKLLTEILTKKDGVLAIIQGILETGVEIENATNIDWMKCRVVAGLIACNLKTETQRESISIQVLELLDTRVDNSNTSYEMVASATIMNVFTSQPTIAEEYFLNKLVKPLIICSEGETFDGQLGCQLTDCILKLHKVYVSRTDPNGKFLQSLSPIVSLLIHVYTFLRNGISYLKKPVEELICSFLKHAEPSIALDRLNEILFGDIDGLKTRKWNLNLELTLDDKAELKVTDTQHSATSDMKWLEDDTTKASTVLSLLSHLQNDDIVCKFFLSQLENLTSLVGDDEVPLETISSDTERRSDLLHFERVHEANLTKTRRSLLILQIMSALCEESALQDSIMKDKIQAIQFLTATLERSVTLSQSRTDELKPMESETLMMAMGILTLMLGSKESVELKAVIKNCVSPLKELKAKHPSKEVRVMAAELEMAIVTDGIVPAQRDSKKFTKKQSELTKYQEAWEDLQDPEIPIRGHAMLAMTKLITAKDKETMENRDKLLVAFMEHLRHEDSYVYMMAIQGLTVLADKFPDKIIPVFIEEYGRNQSRLPIEMRMKLGEVLVKVTRTLGEMTPKYRDQLLDVFLNTTRDTDPLMRSSSLSNLGEVCKELRYALGTNVHEIFNCLSNFAKYDSSVHVRRAAVQVIVLLLRGLGKDALRTLEEIMKELYSLIKYVYRVDDDEAVKLHAQLALEELDIICKEFLFPKQSFEMKIRVIDP